MEIHQLRYFLAVAEARSFSRAAERCRVAQPSLSQQIRKLEADIGQRLFDRLPRGAALTEAGRALLPRARRILAEVHDVAAAVAQEIDAGRGPLVVGAIPTMAPYLLPPMLKPFMRRYPECELTLREDLTDRLVEALLDAELDFAVLSTPIDQGNLRLDVLGQEALLLASARGYTLPREAPALRLSDLDEQPAVVLHEMHCLGQQIESFCSARRVRRRIVCRSTQLSTVLQLVGLGLGVSIVPEMCARADQSPGRVYTSLGRGGPTRDIAVACRVDRSLSRLSREFIAMLREHIGSGRHRLDRRG